MEFKKNNHRSTTVSSTSARTLLLYYTFEAQLFLQPQLAPYCCITLSRHNCFFNLSSHLIVVLHFRSTTVSSTSARTLLFYYTFEAQLFLQPQLARNCFITLSKQNCFFNLSSNLIVVLHFRSTSVSSTSARTLLLYHTFEEQLFLQPQLAPYGFITLSKHKCFFNLSSHVIVLLHFRNRTVSSTSARTLLLYYIFEAQLFLQHQLALYCCITLSKHNCFFCMGAYTIKPV